MPRPVKVRVTSWAGTAPYLGVDPATGELLGVKVQDNAKPKEVLKAAHLDWPVVKRPNFRVVEEPILKLSDEELENMNDGAAGDDDDSFDVADTPVMKNQSVRRVRGSYNLARGDNMRVLTPHVGARYKPIQNARAFEVFDEFVRKAQMRMDSAGSLDGGRIIWGMAALNEGFTLAGGDEIQGYLLLSQSHSYGNAFKVNFTPVRVQGFTTYMEAVRGDAATGQFKMPHSSKFNDAQLKAINDTLKVSKNLLADFERKAKKLSWTTMSDQEMVHFFLHVFQPGLLDDIRKDEEKLGKRLMPANVRELAAYEGANRDLREVPTLMEVTPGINMDSCRGSYWGAVCAIMYFYDHSYGRNATSRLMSSWFGKNAQAKIRALETAYFMANNNGALPEK